MSEIGSGSGTSYPSAIDTDANVEINAPASGKTLARAEPINDLAASVIAVQATLGTDPQGSVATVKDFLLAEHALNGDHGDLTATSLIMSGSLALKQGADIVSAAALAVDISGNLFDVTGTLTITSMESKGIGSVIYLQFDDVLIIEDDGDNLQLGGANITTQAGSVITFWEYETGKWRLSGHSINLASPPPIGFGSPNDITASKLRINPVPTILGPIFTGTGFDDMTASGTFTDTSDAVYIVRVEMTLIPDTFEWNKNGGAFSSPIDMTASPQLLSDGVSVTFDMVVDHTIGDFWTINAQLKGPLIDEISNDVTLATRSDSTIVTERAIDKFVTSSINNVLLGGNLGQGALKTSSSIKSTVSTSFVNITLDGGDFGLYPVLKESGIGNGTAQLGSAFSNSVFMSILALKSSVGNLIEVQQTFIQASPPYDLGDGLCHSFIFLVQDKRTGDIVSVSQAPDPPWANNGPTCIRAEYKRGEKGYRKVAVIDDTKPFSDPTRVTWREQEITLQYKNSDMALIPHPFMSTDLTKYKILLVDPCSKIASRVEEMKNNGEAHASYLFMQGTYITFNTNNMSGRITPSADVKLVNPVWV